jgi:hypothetical protein
MIVHVTIDHGDFYDGPLSGVPVQGLSGAEVDQVAHLLDWAYAHQRTLHVNGVLMYEKNRDLPQAEHSVIVSVFDNLSDEPDWSKGDPNGQVW